MLRVVRNQLDERKVSSGALDGPTPRAGRRARGTVAAAGGPRRGGTVFAGSGHDDLMMTARTHTHVIADENSTTRGYCDDL